MTLSAVLSTEYFLLSQCTTQTMYGVCGMIHISLSILFLRLRTRKGVGKKELGAETTKALRRNSLDKYENLSLAFRTRHGLGLSATAEEAQRLVLNSLDDEGDSEIESNDEEEESVDSEVVWWEEQQRLRKRRKKMDSSKRGMSFPIRRLGSVLIRRQKRYWMKQPPSLSLVDDSDLESEEGETQFGESSMENSFHDSSGLEPEEEEERFAHDFSTVPAYSNNGYQYENRIGNNRCDNDLDSDELDIKENGSDEWVENDDDYEWNIGDFKVTDTCLEAKRNFQDGEDEWLLLDRWDQQEEDKFDDIGVRDWSDDDETVKNEEIDPVVKMNIMPIKKQQQKGYSNGDDPHHYHNRSNSLCIHHQHGSGGGGGGIQRNHAHSNNSQKNLFRLLKNGRNLNGGEALWFEEDESEGSGGVWDRNDDGYDGENDVYSSSSSTEVEEEDDIWNDSEEDDEEYESSVVYEEEIDEEQ